MDTMFTHTLDTKDTERRICSGILRPSCWHPQRHAGDSHFHSCWDS